MAKNCTFNIMNQFVKEVEKMENCILVPTRLQDIGPRDQKVILSQEGNVQDVEGLHDMYLVLKNIKSELLTGHGLELGKDLNPIKKQVQEINELFLKLSDLAKTVSTEYKKEYNLVF